jgi:Family of unknown function (DUF6516)
MPLLDYLNKFRQGVGKLDYYGFAESFEIKEELRANKQLILTAKIALIDGSLLQIKEFINGKYKIDRMSFAYHFQDNEGRCRFRYDNAKHKPPLGFDEHKHSQDGTIIQAPLPSVSEIIDEVISFL